MKLRHNRVDLYRRRRRLMRAAGCVHVVTIVCAPPDRHHHVFVEWARTVRRVVSDKGVNLSGRIRVIDRNAPLMAACERHGRQRSKREIVLHGHGPRGPKLNFYSSGRVSVKTVPIRVVVRRVVHVPLPAGDLGSSAVGSFPVALSGSTPEPAVSQ